MKKEVAKLKKKHRDSIWLDRYGQIWFWDTDSNIWWYLAAGVHPELEPGFKPIRPYFSELVGRINEHYGPFTKVAEANYED